MPQQQRILILLCIALAIVLHVVVGSQDCDDIGSSSFAGKCENKWKNLKPLIRPTQSDVGYAWVQKKYDDDFGSDDDAQDALSDAIPGLLGPPEDSDDDNSIKIYIIDSHHTLAALDYSGRDTTKVTIDIICDWRSLSTDEFWQKMIDNNFVYLLTRDAKNALPKTNTYTELPTRFSFTEDDKVFGDDQWRALASFSRKVAADDDCDNYDDYCERCFIRDCDDYGDSIPFIEFKWGYFFNDAYLNANLWDPDLDRQTFLDAYNSLESDSQLNADLNQWLSTAADLIDLCRSDLTGAYTLPSSLGSTGLPGYVRGNTPLPDDPQCNDPFCPSYAPTSQPRRRGGDYNSSSFYSYHHLLRGQQQQEEKEEALLFAQI